MSTALRVTDLAKSYGGKRAVDGISFDVRAGELTARALLKSLPQKNHRRHRGILTNDCLPQPNLRMHPRHMLFQLT